MIRLVSPLLDSIVQVTSHLANTLHDYVVPP